MSNEKGQFPYSFFILFTQCHEFPTPRVTNFYDPSPSERGIIFKESLSDSTP